MTIPAGMLTERMNFRPLNKNGFMRRGHVNNFKVTVDDPLYADIELSATIRYDGETKELEKGDLLDYDNDEYKITIVVVRRNDRLVDIRGRRT